MIDNIYKFIFYLYKIKNDVYAKKTRQRYATFLTFFTLKK